MAFAKVSHRVHAHSEFLTTGLVRILNNPYHVFFGVISPLLYVNCEEMQATGRDFFGVVASSVFNGRTDSSFSRLYGKEKALCGSF